MNDKKREKVAAVIVSYNRKEPLSECLDAVLRQAYPVEAVYIIDNASTDGTPEYLMERGFIDKVLSPEGAPEEEVKTLPLPPFPDKTVEIHYVRMHENTGGAGGFHEGIRRCYESGVDWVWLMDDDGIPAEDQLAELLGKSIEKKLLFSGPLIIDKARTNSLSFWPPFLRKVENSLENVVPCAEDGIVYGWVTPFNGTLISRKVIEKIGNVKKEMFIWGDEREYELRARANNIEVGTVISATHLHPARKGKKVDILFGLFGRVVVRPASKANIYYRNLGFIIGNYYGRAGHLKNIIKHTVYFLINSGFNIKGLMDFYRYYIDGATDKYYLPPKRK